MYLLSYDKKESVRLIFVYLIEGSDKTFEKINDKAPHLNSMGYAEMRIAT